MTGPEDLLRGSLRDRAEHHELPRTPMADVASTARRIRRRRHVRTGVAAAAVLAAIAAPFALATTRGPDGSIDPAAPTSEPAPDVRLADVPAGPPPSVAWIDGPDYVAADGTRTALPFDDVVRAAPYRGGLLVVRAGDPHVLRVDDGRVTSRACGEGGLAVSDDGSSTAFAVSEPTPGCGGDGEATLHLGPTGAAGGADRTRPMPLRDATPVGVLGDAVVLSPYNEGRPVLLDLDGTSTTLDRLSRATDAEAGLGLVAGQLSGTARQRITGAVVDAATGSVVWTASDRQLSSFSPDGSMVLGVRPGAPGSSLAWSVFDARTGSVLHTFSTPADLTFTAARWEDDEHVLLSTTRRGTEAILRTTLDGTLERATDAVRFTGGLGAVRYRLAPNASP